MDRVDGENTEHVCMPEILVAYCSIMICMLF